jgi:class 3 adenylate cyclase
VQGRRSRLPAPAPKFGAPEVYTPKHLAEKILTSKSALEGERKQVTVLFADLKGSMELLADRDPEEARKRLDPILERMMDAVHRFERRPALSRLGIDPVHFGVVFTLNLLIGLLTPPFGASMFLVVEQSAERSCGTGCGKNVRDHELRGHSMHREKISQILPRELFVAHDPGLYPRGQCGFEVNEEPYAWFLVPPAGSPLDSVAYGQLGKCLLVGGIGQLVQRPLRVDVP